MLTAPSSGQGYREVIAFETALDLGVRSTRIVPGE